MAIEKDNKNAETQEFIVKDRGSLHHYRTEIPNIVFELGLDPMSLALYIYYKKVAGDNGACFQRKDTISEQLQMSRSTIKDRNKVLSQPFKELGGKSLIFITQRKNDFDESLPTVIEVEDIWPENFQKLSGRFSGNGGGGRQKTGVCRQTTTEEEPLNKNPLEELFVAEPPTGSPRQGIFFLNRKGERQEISQDEINCFITDEIRTRKRGEPVINYTFEEVLRAANILAQYDGVVHDWRQFIRGTIKKLRNQQKAQHANGETKWKKTSGSATCNKSSSEKISEELPLLRPEFNLLEVANKFRNGSQNQENS